MHMAYRKHAGATALSSMPKYMCSSLLQLLAGKITQGGVEKAVLIPFHSFS